MAELHQPHAKHAVVPAVDHEESDVDIRAVLMAGAALIVMTLVLAVIVWGLYRYLDAREARQEQPVFPLAVQQEQRLPPEPRLQTNPREDLREMREQEDQLLTTYGWVDRNAGVARIPIAEAMRLTIQRGLPARPSEKR